MLTAKDLLYKVLDYDGFWSSSKRMRNTESSKARKIQLDLLLQAFQISKKNAKSTSLISVSANGLNVVHKTFYSTTRNGLLVERLDYIKKLTDFQYLKYGEFLADADREKYNVILKDIISRIKKIYPAESKIINPDTINLAHIFRRLYSFRHIAYISFETSFLKSTPGQTYFFEEGYADYLKDAFVRRLPQNFTEIDELLSMLIDPEKKTFTKESINYPEFDFNTIDVNWKKKST